MVTLKIELPYSRWDYKVVGVYQITFDTGEFYIGSSEDVRSRASAWAAVLRDPSSLRREDYSGSELIDRISAGGEATLSLLELCSVEDLRDREAEYLDSNRENYKMISNPNCSWKAVLQYKKSGTFIKKHMSIKAAARYNKTTMWRIQEVLNGSRQSHKDMVFIYEQDYHNRRKNIYQARLLSLPKKNNNILVIQYDNDLNYIDKYDTYVEAGNCVGCEPGNIKRAIAGRQQTAAGYRWAIASKLIQKPNQHAGGVR